MDYVEKVLDGVHGVFNLNAATLSGAIDIVVVPQEDGTLRSTPFHVRFGKLQLLNSYEKLISIIVNDELIPDLKMKLGSAGEAYFVEETQEPISTSELTSPIGSPPLSPKPSRLGRNTDNDVSQEETDPSLINLTAKLSSLIQEDQAKQEIDTTATGVGSPSSGGMINPIDIPQEAEQEVSWGWGTFPKVVNKTDEQNNSQNLYSEKVTNSLNTSTENLINPLNISSENLSSKTSNNTTSDTQGDKRRESSWSLFKIFRGSTPTTPQSNQPTQTNTLEPQYLVKEDTTFNQELMQQGKQESRAIPTTTQNQATSEAYDVLSSVEGSPKQEGSNRGSLDAPNLLPPEEPLEEEIKRIESIVEDPFVMDLSEVSDEEWNLTNSKIQISKCAHLLQYNFSLNAESEKIFNSNLIDYRQYVQNPQILFQPDTVFRINDRLYPWEVGCCMIVSGIAFGQTLQSPIVSDLLSKYQQQRGQLTTQKKGWGAWLTWRGSNTTKSQPQNKTNPEGTVFKKTLRPTDEQLQKMKLHVGVNTIRFVVYSKLQGTREVRATIYYWSKNMKIVISDIDGTITRSDVFGQILPIIGKDWSHSGVAQLYSSISSNNYQILYLTARPIGQANITRGYISTLKQGDIRLPPGPVFMSPNRLLTSFNREVILRRPEEFKIQCLKDIMALFPKNSQPFYAGFGNRPTDAISYGAVGVPLGKIFTINYTGEIGIVNYTYRKTFSTLSELVDAMFPTIKAGDSVSVDEKWNYWNYWKSPIPTTLDDTVGKNTKNNIGQQKEVGKDEKKK